MPSDNRKHRRVGIHEDIMFALRSVHPYCYYGGTAVNCSTGGMCFQSRYQAHPGDRVCVRMIGRRLQTFTSLDELTCIGEVRWCRAAGPPDKRYYCIGVHYQDDLAPALFKP